MTATDMITQCDRLKPNSFSYEQKRRWLNVIETDIRLFASRYSGRECDLSFADEQNPELFCTATHADIYLYYLISMIDLANMEYDLYNNSSLFFNSALLKWQKQYRRTNVPVCDVSIKI